MTIEIKNTLHPEIVTFIDECLQKEHAESYLMAILHKVQDRYGFLSEEHMYEVAQRLQVPTSTVSGVSTFYHFFRLKPRGRNTISVCMGTACFVKGADKLVEAFQTELGIKMGETTKDGMFTLENTRCLGVCGLAPVVTLNDKVYSQVTPQQVSEMINRILAEDLERKQQTTI